MDKLKYDSLELARIIGEPRDPRKPVPDIVNTVCELDKADPDEYVYYFDVLQDTDAIYTTIGSGVTQVNVSPDTPTSLSFNDRGTAEYYVKITDLASAKERTLARKMRTINRALNNEEDYNIISIVDSALPAANAHTLGSGNTTFNYEHLINMIDDVIDYADKYTLMAGSQIDKDKKLWDWNDNKNSSMIQAFKELNVNIVRLNKTMARNQTSAESTDILSSSKAYLIGSSTQIGKPGIFVRKKLNDIDLLGGAIYKDGDRPERLVFVAPNPITIASGSSRYLAVGITGYEQIASAITNKYAFSKFTRS